MENYLHNSDAKFVYAIPRETESKAAILHARMIYHGGEYPTTGSAAGPATAWLLRNGLIEPEKEYVIEQGTEINRPSKLFITGSKQDERISNIRVEGRCFAILKGKLAI